MTVNKPNGFKAPYRSSTFQDQADAIVNASGLLTMDGDVYSDSGNVYIPPFEFIQNGLIVAIDVERSVPEPTHPAPYFLAASAQTTAQTDDIQFSFPRSYTDISDNHAIISYFDGIEWRKPQMLSTDEINKDVNQANIDFERFGPISGLLSRVNGPNYETDPGVLVDRQGLRQRLDETFTTSIVANDSDFNRVDRLVYRRANDNINRVGYRQFVLGGAHAATPTGVHNTEAFADTKVHLKQKVLVASDNTVHILSISGYGVSFDINYTKWDSARTSQLVAPALFAIGVDNSSLEAAIDSSDNIHLFYTDGGGLFWEKFDSSGASVTGPHLLYINGTQPASNVRVAYNASEDSFFIVFQVLVSVGNKKVFMKKILNADSAPPEVFPEQQIDLGTGNIENPSIAVTDDLDVFVAVEESSTGQIRLRKFDYLGVAISSTQVLSSSVERIGVGTLVDLAKKPRVLISDNKEVYVTFLQRVAAGIYGLSIWHEDDVFMQELLSPTENFSDYDAVIDGFLNGIHLVLLDAASTQYVKIEGRNVQFSYEIDSVVGQGVATARDRLGAMLHAWSKPASGTFSAYSLGTNMDYVGAQTAPGGVVVLSNEFLVQQTFVTPKVGDQISIAAGPNAGDYIVNGVSSETVSTVDYWRCSVGSNFPTDELNVTTDFNEPDGNSARFVKTNAELTTLAYRFDVLDSDILLARCSQPGPVVLNFGDATVGPVPSETAKLLVYGDGTIIDWGQTSAGNLTISGAGLHVLDMINNINYDIANGSYPMTTDQALYFEQDLYTTAITPQVSDIALLDWSKDIQVLGVIKQNNFAPHSLLTGIGFEEIEEGESNEIGESLPGLIRSRLGILSDVQYQAYLNAYGIFPDDDYATAISKLDALVHGFNTDNGDYEVFEVTNPLGETNFTATKFVWEGDDDITDINVFVNGKHIFQALDGSTVDRGFHKVDTDEIQIHYTVPQGAEVVIQKPRTGGGNAGFLKTYEEGVLVHPITQKLNLTGAGVSASNGGAGQTNIHIPGGPAASLRLVKNYRNTSGVSIPAGTAVAFDDDGGIVPADANIVTLSDFCGVTIAEITAGNYGDVYKLGDAPGVLATMGATPGKLIYLGETAGSLSLTPPTGLTDSIIILGRAETPNASVPDGTAPDLYLNPQIITGGGV